MEETTKPSAPIKPRRGFFMNPWVPAILIICLAIVGGLNATGYITLPHINLSDYYFENLNNPSKTASKPAPTSASKTSCPTNSHQNPSDATKCRCDSGYEKNSAGNECVIIPAAPLNATFDIRISSLTCTLTDTIRGGDNPYIVTYNRAIVRGTARGPVGALVELPILSWPTDVWDCGNWTLTTGAYVAVGDTCTRQEGQPETTNWSIDTGGEETGGYERGDSESYVAKIFSKDLFAENLVPRKEDKASTVCQ